MNLAHVSKLSFLISLIGASASYGCSAGAGTSGDDAGDGDSGGDDSAGGGDLCVDCDNVNGGIGSVDGNNDPNKDLPAPPNCGDGVLNEDEVCDDGNLNPDDGCYANCLGLDPGYICPEAGQACFEFAVCGDGLSRFPEQCDDGNTTPGDGCSDNCKIEIGFKCETDGQACTATTCGDGVVEGAEMCELGDPGCRADCQFAPDCSGGTGACTSSCGDGLVLGEACDDGNTLDGDGCSSTCEPETGYTCTNQSTSGDCERSPDTGECIIRAPTIFRDFESTHSDFEASCGGTSAKTGLVETSLSGGVPVPSSSAGPWDAGGCTENLAEWFVDGANSTTFAGEIVLYDDGEGNFVNRWGANGERWNTMCGGCTAGEYDGNPFFYPVDGIPNARDAGAQTAQISTSEYGMTGGLVDDPSGAPRNFSFTSEVSYWFGYEADTNATLKFVGDDDVWVFVNGILALDLGGVHQALPGEFTISGSSPTLSGGTGVAHSMTPGNVYEIKVFHAERKAKGSSFKLTLSGFDTSRSDCRATCGDGIVAFGEQCDEGENNGAGYNRCGTDCRLGSYCGDGIVDEGEVCDDADTSENATSNCVNCRIPIVR